MPIHIAVRISMSIPFLFVPVTFEDKILVDGGIIDNYPIHVFDGKFPGDPDAKMQLCPQNLKTIGLKLLTPTENTTWNVDTAVNNISSIKKMASSLANTLMLSNEQKYVNPANWARTIPIKVPNYPLSKFKLSEEEQTELINSGSNAVKKFFNIV
jgi:NTE family protein